jgi:hypothetical protein
VLPPQAGKPAELADGVTIEGHPQPGPGGWLRTGSSRDVGSPGAASRSIPSEMGAPFDFVPSRGGDAGSNVID